MRKEGWIGEFKKNEIDHDFGPAAENDEDFAREAEGLEDLKVQHQRKGGLGWLMDSGAFGQKLARVFPESYMSNAYYHLLIGSSPSRGALYTHQDFPGEYSVADFIRGYVPTPEADIIKPVSDDRFRDDPDYDYFRRNWQSLLKQHGERAEKAADDLTHLLRRKYPDCDDHLYFHIISGAEMPEGLKPTKKDFPNDEIAYFFANFH